MCVILDGYKMFRVYDKLGIAYSVAARCEVDAFERITKRGVKDPQFAQWHECYGEYVNEVDDIERAVIRVDIREMIYHDVSEHPL